MSVKTQMPGQLGQDKPDLRADRQISDMRRWRSGDHA
jgi:aspartyl-tRNA synthetase